jgi:hypothetical protein
LSNNYFFFLQKVVISANCDNIMRLYVNGQLLSDRVGDFYDTKTITAYAAPTSVVGVNCVDTGGWAGIMVSASTNMVSDGSWRCSNTFQEGWNLVSDADIQKLLQAEVGIDTDKLVECPTPI